MWSVWSLVLENMDVWKEMWQTDQPPMASRRLRADHPTLPKVPKEKRNLLIKWRCGNFRWGNRLPCFPFQCSSLQCIIRTDTQPSWNWGACMTGYLARHLLIKARGKHDLFHLSLVCYVLGDEMTWFLWNLRWKIDANLYCEIESKF